MSSVDPRRSGMPPFFTNQFALILAALSLIEQASIPEYTGTARYVSPNGDNSDGLTWAKAFHTITAALAVSVERDVVLVEGGYPYNESATLNGLVCNVDQVLLESIGIDRAVITNTDVNPNGAAVTVTGSGITLRNFNIRKGEVASLNSAALRFDGAISSRAENCVIQVRNAATHVAAHFDGGAGGCVVIGADPTTSGCAGVGVGIGVHFEDAVRCAVASTGIGVTTTGVHFDASALLCSVDDKSLIQNTTTGISLSAGASLNILSARILASTTPIADLSGNATNLRTGSLTALAEDVSHIPQFTGRIYFVDGTNGLDTNDGISPATARQTITAGEALLGVGDALTIKAGVYTEDVTVAEDASEIWGEIGAIMEGTLTVSGESCRIQELTLSPTAAVGVAVTGNRCHIEDVEVEGTPTTAFDVDGYRNTLINTKAADYTVSGYDVANYDVHIKNGIAQGDGGARRGIYFSNAAADNGTLENVKSSGNATASFEFVAGCTGSTIDGQCSSGAGDGRWVDADEAQTWNDNFHFANYIEKVNTLTVGGGGGTVAYNLYKVTGSVIVESIEGVVETALTGTNTDTFLDLFSANGSVLLTEDTVGANLGALLVGSIIAKVDKNDEQLAVADVSGPAIIQEVSAEGESVRIAEDRTGAAHVATYIRFTHTCAAAGTGEIHWYVKWRPLSDDGWLAAV